MTIVVTGAGGMLGKAVVRAAKEINLGETLTPFTHEEFDITDQNHLRDFNPGGAPVTIINCAGSVRGRHRGWTPDAYRVNAQGPYNLATRCDRLAQVSTDCVFSGHLGPGGAIPTYNELSSVSPTDWYGDTKAAGEVRVDPHVTVRGSFIGFQHGLLAWFLEQPKGATVPGYTDHWWSGGHVDQYAAGLLGIALDRTLTGIVHLVSQPAAGPYADTTKYQVLCDLRDWLRPDITVEPTKGPDGPRHLILRSTRSEVPTLSWMRDLRCMLRHYVAVTPGLKLAGWRLKEIQRTPT